MKKIFSILILLLVYTVCIAITDGQQHQKDSLLAHLETKKVTDYDYLKTQLKIAEIIKGEDLIIYYKLNIEILDRIIPLTKRASTKEQQERLLQLFANTLENFGQYHFNSNNIEKAQRQYENALKFQIRINDEEGMATSYNALGYFYILYGKIEKALKYLEQARVISEKLNDSIGISEALVNLGMIYEIQGDSKKAIDFYEKALTIQKTNKRYAGAAISLSNIGYTYSALGKSEKAIAYYLESLEYDKKVKNTKGVAITYNNIGYEYRNSGDEAKGLEYYIKCYETLIQLNDKESLPTVTNNIGFIFSKKKQYKKARKFLELSLNLAKEIGIPKDISNASKNLSYLEENVHNDLKALELFKLHIQMRDSIHNISTQKATAQQQAKYEYEKQKAVDDAEHEKQIAIEQEAKSKQKVITYATAGGLGLVAVFLIFVFNRLQVTKKQKVVIETQKVEVELQKEVVELAHFELEEKNKEITDSIQYAKRIQNAILPPLKVVKEYLAESFILYKPKDIVAGDFYWMEVVGNKVLYAAADCTGHGVPGAMVSVVCNNGLNRSVREYGLTDPGEILNKTREIVIAEFEKSEDEVKDGMDIALCSIEGITLKYAGANNPLWIIKNNEIIETKADKQPIGKFDELLPYTTHTFELQKGDSIYIFSDGYVDQFGGEKGKKFKAAAFRELLLSIQDKPMVEQQSIINTAFEDWKGNLEQIDDVCVIGVRV